MLIRDNALKLITVWTKLTEIRYNFFGIHTANVVQLAKRIEQRALLEAAYGENTNMKLCFAPVSWRMEIDEEPAETTGMIYKTQIWWAERRIRTGPVAASLNKKAVHYDSYHIIPKQKQIIYQL